MVEGDCLPVPAPASCFLPPLAWGGYSPPTQHPIPVFIPVPVPIPIPIPIFISISTPHSHPYTCSHSRFCPFSCPHSHPYPCPHSQLCPFSCPHHNSCPHSHPQCCPHSHSFSCPNFHSHPYPCPHPCVHSPHSQPVPSPSWPCCVAVPEAPQQLSDASAQPVPASCSGHLSPTCLSSHASSSGPGVPVSPAPAWGCQRAPGWVFPGSLTVLGGSWAVLAAEQHRDACTRFGGLSDRGPAHCHAPQGACKDLRTCSALWVVPQYQSVPQHPGCPRCHLPGAAAIPCRAGRHRLPCPALGEAFLLFITLLRLPSCQPRASLPALLPAARIAFLPAACLPGHGRGGGGGGRGLQGPSDLHSCIACLQLLNKLLHLPPPPGPLPAARRCLTLCCPAPRPAAAGSGVCPSLPAAGWTPTSDPRTASAPRAGWAARVATQIPRVPAAWHHPGHPPCGQRRRAGSWGWEGQGDAGSGGYRQGVAGNGGCRMREERSCTAGQGWCEGWRGGRGGKGEGLDLP